jgi:hypothetical protein
MSNNKDNNSLFVYRNAIDELYRAFDFFNDHFCDGELQRPIIMIGSSGQKNAYGWFGSKFWTQGDKNSEEYLHELNISAEYMDRGTNAILETLLHEMAHLKNAQAGIKDCSPTQYHNKNFKNAAEQLGLVVKKMGYRGFASTNLDEPALEAIKVLKPKDDALKIRRRRFGRKGNDRYIPLIVRRDEYEEVVDELVQMTGMSKRQLVEEALDHYLTVIKRRTNR